MPYIPLKKGQSAPNVADIAGLMGPIGIAAEAPGPLAKGGKWLLEQFLSAEPQMPEVLAKALRFAQSKYPRLMGHIGGYGMDPIDPRAIASQSNIGKGYSQIVVPSAKRIEDIGNYLKGAGLKGGIREFTQLPIEEDIYPSSLGHELLHAADELTMSKGRRLGGFGLGYDVAGSRPEGYRGNPFEARAQLQGLSFLDKFRREAMPYADPNDAKKLEELVQKFLNGRGFSID